MDEADERFDESLAVMLKAWTSDAPWSHRGTHWQFDSVVVGTVDEVAAKIEALRAVGAEYLLLNSAGGLPTIRRFARELMPAFAAAPVALPAG
jgi:alkanesulfonate monooxygenase SsuD/methylene tetrahydromethanopterin reductase-like flavin-dependent oxidoreductase (luciferase family)